MYMDSEEEEDPRRDGWIWSEAIAMTWAYQSRTPQQLHRIETVGGMS